MNVMDRKKIGEVRNAPWSAAYIKQRFSPVSRK